MDTKLKILFVEDNPSDLRMIKDFILDGDIIFESIAVETSQAYLNAIDTYKPDIILSDYNLPNFNGMEALKIRNELLPGSPFILITGSINEETAVNSLKSGADDYILKDNLRRLNSAIMNALDQKRVMREKEMAEKRLTDSERIYRYMFAKNPQPMWIYDVETLFFLEVNTSALNLYGYTREEFLSMKVNDIIVNEKDYIISDYTRNGPKYRYETDIESVRKDGNIILMETSSHPFSFDDRPARHVLVRDITSLRQSESRIRLLSRAVEQNPVCVIITDRSGIVEYVNPKFTELTGYSLEDLIKDNSKILNSGINESNFYNKLIEKIDAGNIWQGEFQNKKKNGEVFWAKTDISSIMNDNGEISKYIIIMEDVTERKTLLADFIKAKEKAEESDRLKTAFLHNISHEIRTPLNAIMGFAQMLTEQEVSQGERVAFSEIIQKSGQQLLVIIKDIVNISALEAGQETCNKKHFNANSIIRQICDQFSIKAKEQGVAINMNLALPDDKAFLNSDEIKFIQIISNLLTNAFKFTHEGSVELGYELIPEKIRFFVKDTGIGIPDNMFDEIFKRFRQIEVGDSRKYGGSGLGLPICKAYVELLGGEIWLDSVVGEGTTFYFTLPYNEADNNIIDIIQESNQRHLTGYVSKTLIVAEDEDVNFLLIEKILSPQNYIVIRARNGNEAVESCRELKDVNMILMDLNMPLMNGYQANKIIKRERPEIPVLAVTAFAGEEEKRRALSEGFLDFVPKPIEKEFLISKIQEHII
ncbi:MAG: response regulator [Bacteroidales bacterium]|nr:response regulator [Bacteroidales bacterium]